MTDQPRLLIIDDEQDICELIADVAETRGFAVQAISDPAIVEKTLASFSPDCILMDLMMPGIDGVELLRTLGDAIRPCAIALMSGHDARVLNSAQRLGSAHGLNIVCTQEKPIAIEALRETLDKLVASQTRSASKKKDVAGDAVQAADIILHYQPIVEIATGRVRGMEALARWNHPQHGLLSPDNFLAKLDSDGLNELAVAVMETAVRDVAAMQKHLPIAVSINLTYGNLTDLAVPDKLDALCKKYGVAPERVNIEVTETEIMRDVRHITDVLTRLRLRGFGLAIDDFGIGYSSLRELQRLPFSIMKMDKSFVLDLTDNRNSQVITHAIIDLGHNIGLKVVAEGIETVNTWNILKERGCDLGQGFLISKPVAIDKLIEWITAHNGTFTP